MIWERDTIDEKKRTLLIRKLDSMDDQYWSAAVDHISTLSKELDTLIADHRKAFNSYVVSCFEIAEAKYLGYLALTADGLSGEEEEKIENEYKEKLNALAQERQSIIENISDLQKRAFDVTLRPLPKDKYEPEG